MHNHQLFLFKKKKFIKFKPFSFCQISDFFGVWKMVLLRSRVLDLYKNVIIYLISWSIFYLYTANFKNRVVVLGTRLSTWIRLFQKAFEKSVQFQHQSQRWERNKQGSSTRRVCAERARCIVQTAQVPLFKETLLRSRQRAGDSLKQNWNKHFGFKMITCQIKKISSLKFIWLRKLFLNCGNFFSSNFLLFEESL